MLYHSFLAYFAACEAAKIDALMMGGRVMSREHAEDLAPIPTTGCPSRNTAARAG